MAKSNDFSNEQFYQVGLSVGHLARGMMGVGFAGVVLTGLSIRGPRMPGDEFLLVAKGIAEDDVKVVGFHSAFTLEDALRGLEARIRNGTLKWRVDVPFK